MQLPDAGYDGECRPIDCVKAFDGGDASGVSPAQPGGIIDMRGKQAAELSAAAERDEAARRRLRGNYRRERVAEPGAALL